MNFKGSLYSLLLLTLSMGLYIINQLRGGLDISLSLGVGLIGAVIAFRLVDSWEHKNPNDPNSLTLKKLILSFGIPVMCVFIPGQTTAVGGLIALVGLLALSSTVQPPTRTAPHSLAPAEDTP